MMLTCALSHSVPGPRRNRHRLGNEAIEMYCEAVGSDINEVARAPPDELALLSSVRDLAKTGKSRDVEPAPSIVNVAEIV